MKLPMSERRRAWARRAAIASVVACFLYLSWPGQAVDDARTASVQLGSVRKTVVLNGTIWPKNRTNVSPGTTGRVADVLVEKGDLVRKGDVLMTLDERGGRLELQRRTFALERARLQEVERQMKGDVASIETGALDVRQAAFELDAARRMVLELVIRAPRDGRVVHLGVRKGDFVSPASGGASPALVIADTNDFVVELEGDEFEVAWIRAGQAAHVTAPAIGDGVLLGTVVQGSVLKRFATGMQGSSVFGVTVALAPTDAPLQLGYGARVEIVAAEHHNVPVVPVAALVQRHGRDYVMAWDAKAAAMRPIEVKVVMSDDFLAEISGVLVGTSVSLVAGDGILEGVTNDSTNVGRSHVRR